MAEYSPYTTSHDTVGTSTLADNSSANDTLSDIGSFASDDFTSNLFAIVAQNKPITKTNPTQNRKVLVPKKPSSQRKRSTRSTRSTVDKILVDADPKSNGLEKNDDDRTSDLIAALVAKQPSVEDAPESPPGPIRAPSPRPATPLLPDIDESELGSPINESTPEKNTSRIEIELAQARAIIAEQAHTVQALRKENTALREDNEREIRSLTEKNAKSLTEQKPKAEHMQGIVEGLKAKLVRAGEEHAADMAALESNLHSEYAIAVQGVEAEVEKLNVKIVHLEKGHATELAAVRQQVRTEDEAVSMQAESAVADLNAELVRSDNDLKAANQRTEHYKRQATQLKKAVSQKEQEKIQVQEVLVQMEQERVQTQKVLVQKEHEVVRIEQVLIQKEQTEREMDKRLTRDLRGMVKERDRMKQALMLAWAEEEAPGEYGPDGRKVYKYKYVKK